MQLDSSYRKSFGKSQVIFLGSVTPSQDKAHSGRQLCLVWKYILELWNWVSSDDLPIRDWKYPLMFKLIGWVGLSKTSPWLRSWPQLPEWFACADPVNMFLESLVKNAGIKIRNCISCLAKMRGDLKGGSCLPPWPWDNCIRVFCFVLAG